MPETTPEPLVDSPAHDPNENTILKVCNASELEELTRDGWEMQQVLAPPSVNFTNIFLLRRTRDVNNLERFTDAEQAMKAMEAERDLSQSMCSIAKANFRKATGYPSGIYRL